MRLDRIPRHIGWTMVLCLVPFVGIASFIAWEHVTATLVARPSNSWLWTLALVGAAAPVARLIGLWRLLQREQDRFRLSLLIQSYLSMVLVFASLYALVQVSSADTAFLGVTPLWSASGDTFQGHIVELVGLYVDALYLSVMTITTVGFGDIAPAGRLPRMLVSLEALFGIGFIGIALGQYFAFCTRSSGFGSDDEAAAQAVPEVAV